MHAEPTLQKDTRGDSIELSASRFFLDAKVKEMTEGSCEKVVSEIKLLE